MNKELPNNPHSNNEEVDLIRLLDYFKNGIKSLFRKIWQLILLFLQFIILLKKYWIIVLGLTLAGAIYGYYLKHFNNGEISTYEMVVRSNPVTNIELYAFSSEVNNQMNSNNPRKDLEFLKKLGVMNTSVEPIEREEDVVSNYFDQVEVTTLRGDGTDTLYYQKMDIGKHKNKMKDEDYTFQTLRLKVSKNTSPQEIQENLLRYLNNLPGPKNERNSKLTVLKSYERILGRSIENIDSIMASRATLNNNTAPTGSDQLLVNTASRTNVEADLLRYLEIISKKYYGTQKKISDYQNGISVVSNLRAINNAKFFENPIYKYAILAFLLALIIVLLIQFNKYLNRLSRKQA